MLIVINYCNKLFYIKKTKNSMSAATALQLASAEAESNIIADYSSSPLKLLTAVSKLGNLHTEAYGAVQDITLGYNSATSLYQTGNNKIVAITWYCDNRLVITTGEKVNNIAQISVRNYDADLRNYCDSDSIRYVAEDTPARFIREFLE